MAKKRKKITVAGSVVREVVYTPPTIADTGRARGAKRRASSEAQARMNAKHSWQKLADMLAANFVPGDLVVVLTYDDEHYPSGRSACTQRLKEFRAALSAERRKVGARLVMFWNYEHDHGDKRWHHHAVINATGADYEVLRQCWPWGEVLIERLEVTKTRNYDSLAQYMCKERTDKPGQRQWSYTRGAVKPETESFWVPADTTVQAPKGSLVLESYSRRDAMGATIQYVRYLAPGFECGRRPKVRRKPRPRSGT